MYNIKSLQKHSSMNSSGHKFIRVFEQYCNKFLTSQLRNYHVPYSLLYVTIFMHSSDTGLNNKRKIMFLFILVARY